MGKVEKTICTTYICIPFWNLSHMDIVITDKMSPGQAAYQFLWSLIPAKIYLFCKQSTPKTVANYQQSFVRQNTHD